jgi:NF-X1-type zinc finger protein NFXL1
MPCKSEPYLPCPDKCGVLLKCGKHTCQKECHIVETRRQVVEDSKTHLKLVKEEKVEFKPIVFKTKKQKKSIWAPTLANEKPEPCDECKAPCDNPRTCSHICPLGCHLNACLPCQITLTFQCHSHRK